MICLIVVQGCATATKTYGRQGQLTDYERETLTCREINLEMARAHGWIDRVNKEAEFSGLDVVALLSDFGAGQAIERDLAIKSAVDRINELAQLRESKGCQVSEIVKK